MKRSIVVVDDFFPDPDAVRKQALAVPYQSNLDLYKGNRSTERFLDLVDPAAFEKLLGIQIEDWGKHGMNARFQFCTAADPLVFHSDQQQWAGAIYLTPRAPVEAGTSFFKSHVTGIREAPTDPVIEEQTYRNNLLDRTKWEEVDKVGNVYNRLVLWNGKMLHAASCYFGHEILTARLFMLFFFDGAPGSRFIPKTQYMTDVDTRLDVIERKLGIQE